MSYGPWIGDNSLKVSPSTMAHPTLALSASSTPSPTPSSISPSITFLEKLMDQAWTTLKHLVQWKSLLLFHLLEMLLHLL